MKKQHSFEQLKKSELAKKLNSFKRSGELIKTWQKGHQAYQVKLREVKADGEECRITILPLDTAEFKKDQPILLNFFLDGIDYFCETNLIKQDSSIFELELTPKIYMVEKRVDPRFICYPGKSVNLVVEVPYPESQQSDILIFDREKRAEKNFLKRFMHKVESDGVLENKEGHDTLKFNILDLSRRGLSFFCTEALLYMQTRI